ncbi:hypothetical protein [Porphyromonas cangingivalis]|uniref:hypothetical protein n=1 Tax=Porphyromonas cangingivalis TaxID=36874 RepID=UPI00242A6181|nr:hypothetical protein [Porphyromonas cangingivalis]
MAVDYDDSKLSKLFYDMEPKRRLQAIKGAFRRVAGVVRKEALSNLRQDIRSNRQLEKGLRAVVFKRVAGFKVTVGTNKKKNQGYYTNSRGQANKPVLMWLEDGTADRKTRRHWRTKVSRSTGKLKRYGYLKRAGDSTSNRVTNDLRQELTTNIVKTAEKYGCK